MIHFAIANQSASVVPEAHRLESELFGRKLMLVGERPIFEFISWLTFKNYVGGVWDFFEFDDMPLFSRNLLNTASAYFEKTTAIRRDLGKGC